MCLKRMRTVLINGKAALHCLLHRGLGASLSGGLPPVRPGLAGQRPHGSTPPRALLVSVVHRLCGGCPHRWWDPLLAAGVALQPLAEVSPSEAQQQLVGRCGVVALYLPPLIVRREGTEGRRCFPKTSEPRPTHLYSSQYSRLV